MATAVECVISPGGSARVDAASPLQLLWVEYGGSRFANGQLRLMCQCGAHRQRYWPMPAMVTGAPVTPHRACA